MRQFFNFLFHLVRMLFDQLRCSSVRATMINAQLLVLQIYGRPHLLATQPFRDTETLLQDFDAPALTNSTNEMNSPYCERQFFGHSVSLARAQFSASDVGVRFFDSQAVKRRRSVSSIPPQKLSALTIRGLNLPAAFTSLAGRAFPLARLVYKGSLCCSLIRVFSYGAF